MCGQKMMLKPQRLDKMVIEKVEKKKQQLDREVYQINLFMI